MLPWSQSFFNDVAQPTFKNWFIQFTGMTHKGDPSVVLASEVVTILLIDRTYLCLPPLSRYTSFTIRLVEYRCQSSIHFMFSCLVHFIWNDVTPWSLSTFTSFYCWFHLMFCNEFISYNCCWFGHGRQFLMLLNIQQRRKVVCPAFFDLVASLSFDVERFLFVPFSVRICKLV